MGARISREHLSDESLARCRKLLLSELTTLSALAHRYRDNPEVVYELSRDDDALSNLLGGRPDLTCRNSARASGPLFYGPPVRAAGRSA
jgi:hypothetical protein